MPVVSSAFAHLQSRASDAFAEDLAAVLGHETGMSSAGYPFLNEQAYVLLRDRVPQVLGGGAATWRRVEALCQNLEALDADSRHHVLQSRRVVQQVLRTAAITAPPALWLARHVVGSCHALGLSQRLLAGEVVVPAETDLDPAELDTDLSFLTVLGVLERTTDGFRMSPRPEAQRILSGLGTVPAEEPVDASALWVRVCSGASVTASERQQLMKLMAVSESTERSVQRAWYPTLDDISLGYRLLPLVLGMAGSRVGDRCLTRGTIAALDISPQDVELGACALKVLRCAGVVESVGEVSALTPLGRRLLKRGPGPFGIIEAYQPYMARLTDIARHGRGSVHLSRATNIAASQRANRESFRKANDALDRYCRDTGFQYSVFIEHALGRGEATRQRFARSGDKALQYVGADLEDAAIDAAIAERDAGVLPADMVFVRDADIGQPARLLSPLVRRGIDPDGAVMVVGNGFHEIRENTDEGMIRVFSEYAQAGIVLLFTEETALSIRDQQATAWNTYHPAFRYVHEKSGQGLRPSTPGRPDPADPLPMSWTEAAEAGGYRRLVEYGSPGRTIYPCPTPDGHNPSTYVNYFFVPVEKT